MRQTWRQGDARHPLSMGCQGPRLVQRAQPRQHLARFSEGARRRLVQQGQRLCVPCAPSRQIERETGQIRFQDLRSLVWNQPARRRIVPQPVTDARLDPARPAAPLLRRRPADLDRRQPRETARRLEPRHARQAAVDDHPHPFDGQAGLGHRGRQHHLAPPRRGPLDGPVLGLAVQRAVQRNHIHRRIAQAFGQPLGGAVNLPLPRQKDQHRSALLAQRLNDCARDSVLDPLDGVAPQVAGLDREHPPLGLDHRCAFPGPIGQHLGHPADIQRRRHHQQPQILAQQPLRLPRQRQPQIGVQRPFVEFVEQHRPDAFQPRIVENHPREHAFGDDLDPGFRSDPALQAGAIADCVASRLAQGRGHPLRRRPRRQPPWLQHQHLAAA